MPDGTATVSLEEVSRAVEAMHTALDVNKQAVYVHCKAGKGRSWMVCMCYLITYGGRTYENAEALIRMARYQVNPSATQRELPREFQKVFNQSRSVNSMSER
jgi:protein-tyrosine phosphatase